MNVYRLLTVGLAAACFCSPGRVHSEARRDPRIQSGPDLSVDVMADRHPISPYIYGIAFPDPMLAREIGLPLRRSSNDTTVRFQLFEGPTLYEMISGSRSWPDIDRDNRPIEPRSADLITRTQRYSAAVGAINPKGTLLGPGSALGHYQEEDVPKDAQSEQPALGQASAYLRAMRAYEKEQGRRVLDYFAEHYAPLPQNGQTEATALEATRSLWDTTYVEKNEYGQAHGAIALIPALRRWVERDYPGTKTALSEYVWGDMTTLVGTLAEADVLGIFGRERLDLACLYGTFKATDPGANAFRLYCSYNGRGGQFGETGIHAVSTDQAKLSIYAAERSADHLLTLVIINKSKMDLKSVLKVQGHHKTEKQGVISFEDVELGAYAQVYRYSGSDLKEIVRRPDQPVKPGGFTAEYAARSATIIVLPISRTFGGLAP